MGVSYNGKVLENLRKTMEQNFNHTTSDNVELSKDETWMITTPKEKARVKIDRLFAETRWTVVNRDEYEPTMNAVAIREVLLKGNREADYFLMINAKTCDVLEAKREEIDVDSEKVNKQMATYAKMERLRWKPRPPSG